MIEDVLQRQEWKSDIRIKNQISMQGYFMGIKICNAY